MYINYGRVTYCSKFRHMNIVLLNVERSTQSNSYRAISLLCRLVSSRMLPPTTIIQAGKCNNNSNKQNTMISTDHNCVECITSAGLFHTIRLFFFCGWYCSVWRHFRHSCAIFMLAYIWCGQPRDYYYYCLCTHKCDFFSLWVIAWWLSDRQLIAYGPITPRITRLCRRMRACASACDNIGVTVNWSRATNVVVVQIQA